MKGVDGVQRIAALGQQLLSVGKVAGGLVLGAGAEQQENESQAGDEDPGELPASHAFILSPNAAKGC